MAYSAYNIYLNTVSSTPTNEFLELQQQVRNGVFDLASDVYTIQKVDRTTGLLSDIQVRLVKPYQIKNNTSIKDDYYQIVFKDINTEVYLGDVYYFNNYYYMTIDNDRRNSPSCSIMVQKCNVQLKFFDNNNEVYDLLSATPITINGIATDKLLDPTEDKVILLPDDYLMVRIPNDSDGRLIEYDSAGGTRFLLGNPLKCWVCEDVDSITDVRKTYGDNPTDINGILNVKLRKSNINKSEDNLILGIAQQKCYSS